MSTERATPYDRVKVACEEILSLSPEIKPSDLMYYGQARTVWVHNEANGRTLAIEYRADDDTYEVRCGSDTTHSFVRPSDLSDAVRHVGGFWLTAGRKAGFMPKNRVPWPMHPEA